MDEWKELVAKEISDLWFAAGITFGITAMIFGLVAGGVVVQYFALGAGIFTIIASAVIKEKVQKKLMR